MSPVTRGFVGRRRRDPRLPPGQYDVGDQWPVLTAERAPHLDTARWTFRIEGLVEQSVEWTWDEARALPRERWDGDIHCVTTWTKFGMSWEGVPIDTLLAAAGPLAQARYVVAHSHSGYTTSLPLADVTGGRAWLAFAAGSGAGRSGRPEPLTREHGGPARLLVPHLYFWKSVKWVAGLRLLAEDDPGFWERNGYHDRGDPWAEQRFQGD